MLSWESDCNLVASIASFTSVIFKQWSFSGSEGQFTDTGSQGRKILSQKTQGSFGAVKKAADTEFAGDDSAILISVCVSASLRFRFPTEPDTENLVLSPFRDFPIDMQPSQRLSVSTSLRG